MTHHEFSRKGGIARAAQLTPEQRRASASAAARAYWARMSPRQRSAEATRRRAGIAQPSAPASPVASTRTRRAQSSIGQ